MICGGGGGFKTRSHNWTATAPGNSEITYIPFYIPPKRDANDYTNLITAFSVFYGDSLIRRTINGHRTIDKCTK